MPEGGRKGGPGRALPKGVVESPDARRVLIEALASGMNFTAAARHSGYSRVYVHKLMNKPEFRAEVEKIKGAPIKSTKDEDLAIKVLRNLAKNGDTDGVRVSAAKALLDWALRRRPQSTIRPVIKIETSTQADDEAEVEKWKKGG